MKTRLTLLSTISFITQLLLVLLFPLSMQAQDTLKYRIAYYPTWAYDELPAWNIDWGGLTHVILFTNGSITNTSPYWMPVANSSDSIETEFGPAHSAINHLDSLTTICHRKGIKVMTTIQAVDGSSFDYVASDSARTQIFHNTLKAWMIRKHIDGWDLDLESGSSTTAQKTRFMRIGRRVGYDNAFPNGRALIGVATTRGAEYDYPAAQVDSMVTFYDLQCYVYQWMWNGSANATWFQTPVASPSAAGSCENSSLSYDFLYAGKSLFDGWVAAGHDKKKIVIGYSTSLVTGFTGTSQLASAWSGYISDRSLTAVEAMVNYGGTWTRNSTAKSSYIAGTATAGNPLGISVGTKFFLPFEDSTDIKAGIDYLKSVGCVGIMFYDFYGDRRSGQTVNWKRTPYIYAASMYAAKLNGGAAPLPDPSITVTPSSRSFGNVTINTTSSQQTYSVSGSNLVPASGNITVTAPTTFQISKTSGSGFTSSLTYTYTGGVLTSTTVYVRFQPIAAQSYSGNITHAGGSASTKNTAVSGIGETTLPVQLTSFIGSVKGRKVELAWKTATEVNSNTFEIERRALVQWEKIGELQAAGTSNTLHEYTYTDNLKQNGPGSILYRLKTINNDGSFQYSAEVEVAPLPISFSLEQNYPNPFNPQTKIQYSLPENAHVQLKIYDVMGREVAELTNEVQIAGNYERTFNSMNLSSGVYFYRMTAQTEGKSTFIQMKKMVLIK